MMNDLDDTPLVRDHYERAPFTYMGSKFSSLHEILPRLPYRNSYIEPFGGSGVVLLNRRVSKIDVFNDRYAGVVAFYRCLRDKDKLDALIERIELTIHAREEFIWCRDTWENVEDDVERAARWYYMIQTSFLSKGQAFARTTSTPFVQWLKSKLPIFPAVHFRLQEVIIENQHWKQCIKDYDNENAVFYLDPPYLGVGSGVYKHGFQESDHVELLNAIQSMRGFVALSGYPNKLYDSYKWDYVYTWDVCEKALGFAFQETNNQKGKETRSRSRKQECLWVRE
jgi:DNA adenine methylase